MSLADQDKKEREAGMDIVADVDAGIDVPEGEAEILSGVGSSSAAPEDLRSAAPESGFRVPPPLMVLYVFSGPHLGAMIELSEGRYLLGSDDSCDLILSGSSLAPRHAVLTVARAPSGLPDVAIRALDGSVRLEESRGEDASPGAPSSDGPEEDLRPAAGLPWYVGVTCMVWNRPGIPQAAPEPRLEGRRGTNPDAQKKAGEAVSGAGTGDVHDGQPMKESGAGDASDVGGSVLVASDVGDADDHVFGTEDPVPPSTGPHGISRKGRIFLALIVLILLGSMSVVVAPHPIPFEQYPGILEQKLQEAGLTGLVVRPFAQGVEVRGTVENEDALTAVRDLARDLHFPVYLDVPVRGDLLRAVDAAFRARGFYPSVSLLPGGSSPAVASALSENVADTCAGGVSEPSLPEAFIDVSPAAAEPENYGEAPGGGTGGQDPEVLLIAAYVQDRLMEEGLFASLREDVTGLPPVRRHIVHREDVAAVLEPALSEAGLGDVAVAYLPGTLELRGQFGAAGMAAARAVLAEAGHTLGVPLQAVLQVAERPHPDPSASLRTEKKEAPQRFALDALASLGGMGHVPEHGGDVSEAEERASQASLSVELAPAFSDDPLGGLRVTGVTMSPLRFVTTADGQRLFEGAVLPGGFTLEEISTTALKLRRGERVVTYRLRGV